MHREIKLQACKSSMYFITLFFTIKGSLPACTGGNGNVHVTVYSQLVSPFIYITGNKVGVSSENETFA